MVQDNLSLDWPVPIFIQSKLSTYTVFITDSTKVIYQNT